MKLRNTGLLIALISLASLLWGCNRPQPEEFNPSRAESALPAATTLKAGRVLYHYFRLKDALVASKSKDVAQAAVSMKASLDSLLQDSVFIHGNDALRGTTDTLSSQLKQLLLVKDESCEQQRIFFSPLSEAMYHLLKETGMRNIKTYRQFCPMAFNEQGAYWLSLSQEIENPYFGARMLTCGEVTDTLQ